MLPYLRKLNDLIHEYQYIIQSEEDYNDDLSFVQYLLSCNRAYICYKCGEYKRPYYDVCQRCDNFQFKEWIKDCPSCAKFKDRKIKLRRLFF